MGAVSPMDEEYPRRAALGQGPEWWVVPILRDCPDVPRLWWSPCWEWGWAGDSDHPPQCFWWSLVGLLGQVGDAKPE